MVVKLRPTCWLLVITLTIFSANASYAADTSPPQLVDWTLQTGNVDITRSSQEVSVSFIVSDESRMLEPKLLVKSLQTTQLSSFATIKEIARSAKLVSYRATTTISFGQSSGDWEWVLYPLSDDLGNTNNSFGPGRSWVSKFLVFDKTFTFGDYQDKNFCLQGLKQFNRIISQFNKAIKIDPDNVQLSVLKFKFKIPDGGLSEDLCETDRERTMMDYGFDSVDLLTTELQKITDELAMKEAWLSRITSAKSLLVALTGEIDSLLKMYPSQKEQLVLLKNKVSESNSINESNILGTEKELAQILSKITSLKAQYLKTSKTITCIKGKISKKVTDVTPKCPPGYKVKK